MYTHMNKMYTLCMRVYYTCVCIICTVYACALIAATRVFGSFARVLHSAVQVSYRRVANDENDDDDDPTSVATKVSAAVLLCGYVYAFVSAMCVGCCGWFFFGALIIEQCN